MSFLKPKPAPTLLGAGGSTDTDLEGDPNAPKGPNAPPVMGAPLSNSPGSKPKRATSPTFLGTQTQRPDVSRTQASPRTTLGGG